LELVKFAASLFDALARLYWDLHTGADWMDGVSDMHG